MDRAPGTQSDVLDVDGARLDARRPIPAGVRAVPGALEQVASTLRHWFVQHSAAAAGR